MKMSGWGWTEATAPPTLQVNHFHSLTITHRLLPPLPPPAKLSTTLPSGGGQDSVTLSLVPGLR